MINTDNLIETLSADIGPLKPIAPPFVVAASWAGGLTFYLGLMIAYFGLRGDLHAKLHVFLFSTELGLLVVLMTTSALSALLLSYPDLYQKRALTFSPLLVLLIFIAVLVCEWLRDVPAAPMPAHGMDCLLCISELSLLPAAFFLYRMRKFATVHPYAAGAIAFVSAFSIGAFILRLAEQTDSIRHIVEWHYLPMAGVALMGVVFGRLLLKW